MWVSPPVLNKAGSRERFKAGNSLLLHYFFRGDDDQALHDHPWAFRTRILTGGYLEHLPPREWRPHDPKGPAWDKRIVPRNAGEEVVHMATDLHCVGVVQPGTFTLVDTGPREREWGFHPPGMPWINADDYLAVKA
jgi:hypothetical protein